MSGDGRAGLHAVLREFRQLGYAGEFGAHEGGTIHCFACRREFSPADAEPHRLRPAPGDPDADDAVTVVAVQCPHCSAKGTLVLRARSEGSGEVARD